MDFLKKLSNKRKIKYGAILAIFLVLVIAVIVIFNSLVTVLGKRFNWFFDMTEEQFYTASDEFVKSMKKVNGDAELEIIFWDEEDTISNDHSSVNGQAGLAFVHQTATDLAKKLDNVTVSYYSTHNYAQRDEFEGGSNIKEYNVIIRRKGSTLFEIFNPTYFYAFDEEGELFAYNGETALLEAAMRVSKNDDPTVYFTANHGEVWYDIYADGEAAPTALGKLFKNAGINVAPINLTEPVYICRNVTGTDENGNEVICNRHYSPLYDFGITQDTEREMIEINGKTEYLVQKDFLCRCQKDKPDPISVTIVDSMLEVRKELPSNTRAIVINKPTEQFSSEEIPYLTEYLKGYGLVMTFLPDNQNFNNVELYGWLKTWGGVNVLHGNGLLTTTNGSTNITGYIPSDEENAAANGIFVDVSKDLTPALSGAYALETIPFPESGDKVQRTVYPILTTSSSTLYGTSPKPQSYALMTVTSSDGLYTIPDNDTLGSAMLSSYLVVCTSGFTDYLTEANGANTHSKILGAVINSHAREQIYPVDIDFKVFNDNALDLTTGINLFGKIIDLTQAMPSIYLVTFAVVIPFIIGVVGFVVILRRKFR